MIIFRLLRLVILAARYQLLSHSSRLYVPAGIKITGRIMELLFYPTGLLKRPKESFGERLSSYLERLGPVYVKFGQTLSTRPDLITEEIAEQLQYLQDRLPPFDGTTAKAIISREFNKDINKIFTFFDEQPIAAASIAQVHKACLITGEQVAVKILRPGIQEKYNADIRLLYFLARWLPRVLPKFSRLKLKEVVDIFKATMRAELDLRTEAAAASEMSDNSCLDNEIYIPEIYWNLTSESVLTIEWLEGISIYDNKALAKHSLDPAALAVKIAVMFFNQAYRDGFFHADLHPGNILVRPDGRIALVDFGIMGRLSEKDRTAVGEILLGFLQRDYKRVARVHLQAGYIPANTDPDIFAQSCRAICEPIFGLPNKDISIGRLLARLFKVTEEFGMETQPQLLLLQKTMIVVEGIGQSLNPEINMWQLAEPWIRKWAVKHLSLEARLLKSFKKLAIELLERLSQ